MTIERITDLPQPPDRPVDGHKGTFGNVAIIGGSVGMSGAAALAGVAALRAGAGLVFVAVPEPVLPIVASFDPSYLTIPLLADDDGIIAAGALQKLRERLALCDAVAIGPGIGRSESLTEIVRTLYVESIMPMVFDADALNALASISVHAGDEISKLPPRSDNAGPRILTPHPGEFARLLDSETAAIQQSREIPAVEYAKANAVVLLLKGPRTIITDGQRLAENSTGNSGLATGGSGDVLTGLITSLIGQGMEAFEAAQLGAHLHGLAGDVAAKELTQRGLIASDLAGYLPAAWQALGAR